MRVRPILMIASVATAVLLASCGSGVKPLALVASSPGSVAVGQARILLGLVDPETQAFLADPDVEATATFVGPNEQTIAEVPLDFVWAVPDVRGLYRAEVDLPEPGGWSVAVSATGYETTEPTLIMVAAETAMPQIGDPGPVATTRTAADADLAEISSDPDPDPALYRLSLDDALADGRPTVIVFATPAFCASATCGPVLETVKGITPDHPGADFVHVEIYENLDAATTEHLVPVPAVEAWGLPSEPWVFVTDADGIVTALFEGTVGVDELTAALSEAGA